MDYQTFLKGLSFLLQGAWTSLIVSVLAIVLGTLFGFILSLFRLSQSKILRNFAFLFIWIFRGVPLLMILFWAYYAMPFGIKLLAFQASLLGMTLQAAAYKAEIIRTGMLAIPKGQIEAAEAVGMSPLQVMRCIKIPQVIRTIIPMYISNCISLLKGSAQISVITVPDLMLNAQTLFNSTYRVMESLGMAALLYLIMTSLLMLLQVWSEKRFKTSQTLT